MPVRVFASAAMQAATTKQELDALTHDFKLYKEQGIVPDNFGRDAPYHRPQKATEEELRHLHLNDGEPWPIHALQFNKTSDSHLVYCPGFKDPHSFALLALLNPNAHDKADVIDIMNAITKTAEAFRNNY